MSAYAATKHGVTAFTKGLRYDAQKLEGLKIRVTVRPPSSLSCYMVQDLFLSRSCLVRAPVLKSPPSPCSQSISPGAVHTEMTQVYAENLADPDDILKPEDVSNAVLYVLSCPPAVEVSPHSDACTSYFINGCPIKENSSCGISCRAVLHFISLSFPDNGAHHKTDRRGGLTAIYRFSITVNNYKCFQFLFQLGQSVQICFPQILYFLQ